MSDYTKTTNFTAKDSLSTGDPLKLIKGSLFDTEFDNLVTAIATKYDSADIASQAQAEALSSNTVLMTPGRVNDILADNASMLQDIQALTDPGADRLLGWDESANAAIAFSVGAGLAFTTTVLNLADAVAGAGLTISSSILAVQADEGVKIESDNVRLVDVAAGAAQPVKILNGTFTFPLGGITELTGSNVSQSADGYLASDAGVLKIIPYDQNGIIVVSQDAAQTFAITDANTLQKLTGTTNRVWTIPPNSSVAFEVGTVIICNNSGTGDLTITAGTGVIIDSVFHAAAATAQSDRVRDGGTAVLIKTATDTWALSGDIFDS